LKIKANGKEISRTKGIYEFLSNDKLKLNINLEGEERPKNFTGGRCPGIRQGQIMMEVVLWRIIYE
jgi:hypothetical protein